MIVVDRPRIENEADTAGIVAVNIVVTTARLLVFDAQLGLEKLDICQLIVLRIQRLQR
jgi:hypothetical protein